MLTVVTTQSRVRVAMAARTVVRDPIGRTVAVPRTASLSPHGFAGQVLHCERAQGQPLTVEKVVAVATSRDPAVSEPTLAAREAAAAAGGFAELLAAHERAWGTLWERFDLAVDADDEVVLALRLHTFHLLQTLSPHTAQLDAGVPACGLHGEGYHGHVFWDEMFVFPVLNLRLPALSRALLLYRWRRLDAARRSARCAGRSGAMFPWQSGSDGREETPTELYDTAARQWIPDLSHLQRHVAGGHHLAVGGRGHARGSFPLAIGVLQILALDIGTDLLPALALGAEPPNPRTLTCSPAWATPSMRRRSSRRTGGRRGTQHRRPATAPPTGRTGRRATGRPAGVVAAGCRGCHRGTRRLARYRDHRLGRVSEHRDRGGAAGPRRSA